MKRCSKCVLPGCTPNILFDEEGVCSYCRAHSALRYKGEPRLLKLLDSHRRPNSKYDCIVAISGGRDSTYVLLKLVKDYRMKVLAVNYENPFVDPQAKDNIENAVRVLNVDIVRFRSRKNVHRRTFRDGVAAWFQKPSPALVPMICIGCKTIWFDILKIAKRFGIHCIVSGQNRLEDVSFKKVLLGLSANESIETAFAKSIFGILRESSRHLAYFRPRSIPTMVKGYLFADAYAIGSRVFGHDMTRIDLFFFIEWDEREVLSRISSELGWKYPRRFASSWRFDCRVAHLKDFMYMKTIGMTERDDFYATMVREGLMTREDALERLKKENQLYLGEIRSLLNEVGIKDPSFLNILGESRHVIDTPSILTPKR